MVTRPNRLCSIYTRQFCAHITAAAFLAEATAASVEVPKVLLYSTLCLGLRSGFIDTFCKCWYLGGPHAFALDSELASQLRLLLGAAGVLQIWKHVLLMPYMALGMHEHAGSGCALYAHAIISKVHGAVTAAAAVEQHLAVLGRVLLCMVAA